ncbi:hypothetical protein [Bacillus benzoevorans]|uniref:Membrane-associated HD superfamily phosphohydrolase n=2 Tax=Bacillus benzoevorans TaxID=1456 RepID=A0A7X0HSF1_9BACI|nr:hypothetical protein [Bacillus benzoevorans]MBB6445998.1 membrane-associated HD superfamily phosphohydrolase [Bacillus benzoevorans]
MDETRKQIIIKEIDYWKEHHLLPEQYCNFLLALYTEGNGIKNKRNKLSKNKKQLLWLLVVPVFIFFLYFTELSLILQIAISIIFLFIGTYLTIYFTKQGFFYQIPLILTAIFVLLMSVEVVQKLFSNHIFSLYGILLCNCFIWLFSGIKLKLVYFTISGILGMILLLFFFLSHVI